MKTKRIILCSILAAMWLSVAAASATDETKAPAASSDEFDYLLNQPNPAPPQPPQPPQLPQPPMPPQEAPGMVPPPPQPPAMEPGPGLEGREPGGPFGGPKQPGMPQGGGIGQGHWRDRARERQPLWEQIDPQTLMNFLKENEPKLAEKLEKLQAENPEKYNRAVKIASQHYAPAIYMSSRDPEMSKLICGSIREQLKTEWLVGQYRDASPENQPAVKTQLKQAVSVLYDVILKQEEVRQGKFETRFKAVVPDNKPQGAPADQAAAQSDTAKAKHPRLQHFQQRLEQHQRNIESWRNNRTQIIDQHVEQLINGIEPFPWHRP
jgi:hypothetical protein